MSELIKQLAEDIVTLSKNRWIRFQDEFPEPKEGRYILYYLHLKNELVALRSYYDNDNKLWKWIKFDRLNGIIALPYKNKTLKRSGGYWMDIGKLPEL